MILCGASPDLGGLQEAVAAPVGILGRDTWPSTEEGRTPLASASNRLLVVLETTVTDAHGPVCRNVFSSILTGPGSR